MRAELADSSLARYAGRFVWLSLNYDVPANQEFLTRYGADYTPSFFVIDPADEHSAATQLGGMTLPELTAFLDRGEKGVLAKVATPAGRALAKGDELLGRNQARQAVVFYRQALQFGGKNWPDRGHAIASLTWALMRDQQAQPCAETAVREAPALHRDETFSRMVLAGLYCVAGEKGPWAATAAKTIYPLAEEAIALPATLRDHRFQIYQQLMYQAKMRGDKTTLQKWGDAWLKEIDAITPANDDERSALDVARVDAAGLLGQPERVIPALKVSEQTMPTNYNASLRLAQMLDEAKQFDQSVAACDRGLKNVTGPLGRTWLLTTKADALTELGRKKEAHQALEEALQAARTIGTKRARERNVRLITEALAKN
jgi:tetratricopeptide (TPR) repeat protein